MSRPSGSSRPSRSSGSSRAFGPSGSSRPSRSSSAPAHAAAPSPNASWGEALRVLREGGVILYPTDTIWGLGCDATDPAAVERIFRIKARPEAKSLVLLVSDLDMLARYVKAIPDIALDLVEVNDRPMTIIYPDAVVAPSTPAPSSSPSTPGLDAVVAPSAPGLSSPPSTPGLDAVVAPSAPGLSSPPSSPGPDAVVAPSTPAPGSSPSPYAPCLGAVAAPSSSSPSAPCLGAVPGSSPSPSAPGAAVAPVPADRALPRPDRRFLAANAVAADGSVGIRIPLMPELCDMIRRFGRPIVSTSANVSGEPSPRVFADIPDSIRGAADYIVDPSLESSSTGLASQILKLSLSGEVQILRM
ncbi:MAG: Sua5/YciO/YrdC/YwlC family protein [Bacteroidales bacterium]|nr:Sua5/YciO/YrdC/YwlC family protein [Bacteroidales bacterium]